jgi:hypothetical protein
MSKWTMQGHFRYLRFKTFSMTPRTPQCKVFWALMSSSKHLGVPEDSKSPTLGVGVSSSHFTQSGVTTKSMTWWQKTKHVATRLVRASVRTVWMVKFSSDYRCWMRPTRVKDTQENLLHIFLATCARIGKKWFCVKSSTLIAYGSWSHSNSCMQCFQSLDSFQKISTVRRLCFYHKHDMFRLGWKQKDTGAAHKISQFR